MPQISFGSLVAARALADYYGYCWAVRDTYLIPEFDEIQVFAGRYTVGEF